MLTDYGVPFLIWLHDKVDAFACYLWSWIDELDVYDQADV